MQAEARDTLAEAAAAVADGYSPDWDSLQSRAPDHDRAAIRRLRAIGEIGRSTIEVSLTGTISDPLSDWVRGRDLPAFAPIDLVGTAQGS